MKRIIIMLLIVMGVRSFEVQAMSWERIACLGGLSAATLLLGAQWFDWEKDNQKYVVYKATVNNGQRDTEEFDTEANFEAYCKNATNSSKTKIRSGTRLDVNSNYLNSIIWDTRSKNSFKTSAHIAGGWLWWACSGVCIYKLFTD